MSATTLVYDDDCGFCTWWASYLADRSDITLVGFSELDETVRDRLPENYERCSHLVTDDHVYSCGASIEAAFVRTDLGESTRPFIEFLRNFEEYGDIREWFYRHVADNRDLGGRFFSKTPPIDDDDGSSADS